MTEMLTDPHSFTDGSTSLHRVHVGQCTKLTTFVLVPCSSGEMTYRTNLSTGAERNQHDFVARCYSKVNSYTASRDN